MKTRLLHVTIVTLLLSLTALTSRAQTMYKLYVAGVQVTSDNCADLSAIEGVTGKASYNPESNTLTLDGATILNAKAENGWGSARGLYNMTKGLTINLIGENSITSQQSGGIANGESITITGEGSLKVTGTSTGKESYRYGILNMGKITVRDCSLEVKGALYGIKSGKWAFENCSVRTQGGVDGGSFGSLDAEPTFTKCAITAPSNTKWVKNKSDLYNLCDAEGKVVTDLVTITKEKELEMYKLYVAGVQVTSDNCADLSAIEGVTGKASYDPESNTLTLDGATILNAKAENGWGSARGLYNMTKGLTISLIGENSITAQQSGGIANGESITITGEGSLKVTGTSTGKESYRYGILNMGKITVRDCSLEVKGALYGIKSGKWAFENCSVRTQGGVDGGSFGSLDAEPTFTKCAITAPSNTKWVKNKSDLYNLCDAEGKAVTDLVTITRDKDNAIEPITPTQSAESSGVYNLQGIRLSDDLQDLPDGIYIVNGAKVIVLNR